MSRNPHNIGAEIKAFAAGSSRAVAAGTGDATEVNGPWVDRLGYHSALAVVAGGATLTEDETITVAFNIQDADDSSGTGAADYGDAYAAATAATGGTGGTTEGVVAQKAYNLSSARRYVRLQFTPNLSAGATDVSTLGGALVLGGADAEPTQ